MSTLPACQHFHHYIFDRHVEIEIDHTPLEKIPSANSNPPLRIARWLLRLQAYDYTITYQPGHQNAADILSRSPLKVCKSNVSVTDQYISFITNNAVPKTISLDEIREATINDDQLSKMITAIQQHHGIPKHLKQYFNLRYDQSTNKGISYEQSNCNATNTQN